MTIRTEMLKDLRKQIPISEFRTKYRSIGLQYDTIREYLPELEKKVEETRTKFGKLKTALTRLEAAFERVTSEEEKVSGEVQDLAQTKEKLTEAVARKTAKLDSLNAGIGELQAKGFTPEIMSEIITIESRSGPNLLHQVRTFEESRQIKREVSSLKKLKTALEGDVRNLSRKKEKLEKKLCSKRNQLDELRLKTGTFKEAVAIVSTFFKAGYSTDNIRQLQHGLNMLGIRDDPLLSIKRLVKGLSKCKNLVALQDEIRAGKKELEKLKSAISDAKSELKVAKQLTKTFEEVKNAGVEAITGVAKVAKMEIADTAGMSEKHMTASAGEFDAHIQRTMEEVRTGLAEWSDLQEKKGRLKEILHPAQVLFGILKSPEYLRQLPPAVVFQVLDRLHLWCEMNLKDVSIQPSRDLWKKDANLNFILSYRLPVLLEFVCEGLSEIITRQSMKE